jgi:hypothetical protein
MARQRKSLLLEVQEVTEKFFPYGFEEIDKNEMNIVRDIIWAIAEIRVLPEKCDVRIDGAEMPAAIVAEVFGELTTNELLETAEKVFYAGTVTRKKTYIRTALYNAAMERGLEKMNFKHELYGARR